MKRTTLHFIEYAFFDGSTKVGAVKERRAPSKFPKNCRAYRFFDKLKVVSGSTRAVGKSQNITGWIDIGK